MLVSVRWGAPGTARLHATIPGGGHARRTPARRPGAGDW